MLLLVAQSQEQPTYMEYHKMNKVIVNCETGEQEIIKLEGEELAAQVANEQASIVAEKAIADAELVKATKKAALLEKLGITADEAKLLLS